MYEWNGGCCPHDHSVLHEFLRVCLDCGETEEIEDVELDESEECPHGVLYCEPSSMIGKIPDDLKASIDRYVETGCPTGGFLEACIDNNLSEAVGRADERNIRLLPEIVSYLYNHCPSGCWGKAGAAKAWTEKKLKEGQAL